MTDKGETIINLVAAKRYEEALGIGYDAHNGVIREAHISLVTEYDDNSDVINALNEAKDTVINETLGDKGIRLSGLGLKNESLPFLKKALDKEPQDSLLCNWLGSTLCQLYRYAESLPYLEKALELEPDDILNNYWYGTALRNLNRTREAIPYLKRGGVTDLPVTKPKITVKHIIETRSYEPLKHKPTKTIYDSIANKLLKWPIILISLIVTFGVFLLQQNLLVTVLETIVGIVCLYSMHSSVGKAGRLLSESAGLSLFVLIWGGMAVSTFVILTLLESFLLLNVFLAFAISSLTSIALGLPIAKAMVRQSLYRSGFVQLGCFCILFLFPFGLVSLIFPSTIQTVGVLVQPMQNALLSLPQFVWSVIISLPRLIISFILLVVFLAFFLEKVETWLILLNRFFVANSLLGSGLQCFVWNCYIIFLTLVRMWEVYLVSLESQANLYRIIW